MNEQAQALALADLGQALLACVDGHPTGATSAVAARQLLEIAHECREIAQRVILHSAGTPPLAWERRHLLAEMALRLALNIEYTAEGCGTCTAARSPGTCGSAACATTRDALRNTTIIVLSVLNAHRFAEDRRRAGRAAERLPSRMRVLS
ncbi:hypothetical protein SMC26_26640 [Actinomadura fulvescens]|uniref:Uncharacterized protein n=1 Tax=Actinomadura fulvescens TaxID=46160 RepID=A0ABN3PIE7_9ACTN